MTSFEEASDAFRAALGRNGHEPTQASAYVALLGRFRTFVSMQFPLLLATKEADPAYPRVVQEVDEALREITDTIARMKDSA